jgi:hypothetical protein
VGICERSDNDPVALLSRVLGALDRIEPVSAQATALLAASAAGVDVVPGLVASLSAAHAEALPSSPRLGSCCGHGHSQRLPC